MIRRTKKNTRRRRFALTLHTLEERLTPATVSWDVDASGAWEVASNWRDDLGVNRLPAEGDDVVIDRPAGTFTVPHASGSHAIKSLTISDPFTLSGGALTVAGTLVAQSGNSFVLGNGTLARATVAAGTTITQTGNGTLDGVTIASGSTVQLGVGSFSTLSVRNGLTVDGTVLVGDQDGTAYYSSLTFTSTQTIGGTGSIVFGNHASNTITTEGNGLTITLGPDLTVRGKSGALRGSNTSGHLDSLRPAGDNFGGCGGRDLHDRSEHLGEHRPDHGHPGPDQPGRQLHHRRHRRPHEQQWLRASDRDARQHREHAGAERHDRFVDPGTGHDPGRPYQDRRWRGTIRGRCPGGAGRPERSDPRGHFHEPRELIWSVCDGRSDAGRGFGQARGRKLPVV